MKQICVILFSVVLATVGCSTSKIMSSWKRPDAVQTAYSKILVLGIVGDPDRTLRENMEQSIASDLRSLGYNASCACELYAPKAFEGLAEKDAVRLIAKDGFDAVMTVVLLDKRKERFYTPGQNYYSPSATGYGKFWGYYTTMREFIYEPGYYSMRTNYFWETNLYDLNGTDLVYSAQSQSFDPASTKSMAHEYGMMIVQDMQKKNILKKQSASALKSF